MDNPLFSLYANQLDVARADTLKLAGSIGEQQRLFQLKEGKATPLWLIGHLANTINTILIHWMLGEKSLLTRDQRALFAPEFAGGIPPSTDPTVYPAWEEVVQLYDQVMARAIEGVRSMDDGLLDTPLQGSVPDPLRAVFSTNGVTLIRLISHDAYHRGQMGLLSKLN